MKCVRNSLIARTNEYAGMALWLLVHVFTVALFQSVVSDVTSRHFFLDHHQGMHFFNCMSALELLNLHILFIIHYIRMIRNLYKQDQKVQTKISMKN